jgi:predicted regulator of Ras-like GTPase activity (Roadblock/LC7/MglB family)
MYQALLDKLVTTIKGAESALLLDAEGELVVQSGVRDERHRLIGAYQGLALAAMKKIVVTCDLGGLDYVVRRHSGGSVVLRPLKDGYYLVVSMAPGVPAGPAVFHTGQARQELNEEL